MKIDSFLEIAKKELHQKRSGEIKKEQTATDFEELFARQLVKEMTKDSFKMNDNNSVMGQSNLYREFVTDALAGELAEQRKLGMADLITRYWDRRMHSPKENS